MTEFLRLALVMLVGLFGLILVLQVKEFSETLRRIADTLGRMETSRTYTVRT